MSKRKTTEQYIKELQEVNSNILLLEEYCGRDTKIKHKCLICGNEWEVRPSNLLGGCKCPECQKAKGRYHVKKTHEEYVRELKSINPTLECVEEYKGTNTGILHKCSVCQNEWVAQPANILSGMGCPICAKLKNGMKRRKTFEKYILQLSQVNPYIVPTEEYLTSDTKIPHKCLLCGNIFMLDPAHALKGVGCSICNNAKRIHARYITQEDYIERCSISSPNTKILGKYSGARKSIFVECSICGFQWNPMAENILKGHGCPRCASVKTSERCKKTTEEYLIELTEKYPHIKIKEQYNGADVPILHYCSICGNEFLSRPANVLSYGCGKCSKPFLGEERIKKYLISKAIDYIQPYRFSDLKGKRNPLSYDFYLPQYNCLIEFQGAQHEYPIEYFGGQRKFEIQQKHDKQKREYAKIHKIKLVEIWYYNFDKIEEILDKELNIESVETVTET